ncbi:unnamed protein product [Discula destructiva]
MGSEQLHEGQVIEVLFDADQHLTEPDWQVPACEPSRHIPPVPIHLFLSPSSRRSSTSSLSSPFLLSPTRPPSPTSCAWDAARKTAPRPTSTFLPRTLGLHETALYLLDVPGAEEGVRQLAQDLMCARELQPVQRKSCVPTVEKAVAEVTETMSIQRLTEEIARAEREMRMGPGLFKGVRMRFQLEV